MVLAFEALFEDLELQHAHHAHDDALHTAADLAEDLDGTLLGQLLHALDELLALEGVDLRDASKMLGGKVGMPENLTGGLPVHTVSPIEKMPGSKRPTMSPAKASSTVARSSAIMAVPEASLSLRSACTW